MTIDEVNRYDRRRFIDEVGWVFEGSPWVAERAWSRRPFATLDALCEAMIAEVRSGPPDAQLALLRAHPDLGSRAGMSHASTSEQSGAGLDSLSPVEFEQLLTLNREYRSRFGFPFLFAVKGRTKGEILRELESRLHAEPERELSGALEQVYRIARLRLEEMIS